MDGKGIMEFSTRGKTYRCIRPKNYFRGMVGRSWKDFDAMVFKFPFSSRWGGVWMPFCPRMDVLFLNNDKVVHKRSATPITLDPRTWRVYESPVKYDKILEIKPETNIRKGDRISWK